MAVIVKSEPHFDIATIGFGLRILDARIFI
jgi:hypothetical protein